MNSLEWDQAVQRAGFQELEVSLSDNVAHIHMTSLLATSFPSSSQAASTLPAAILIQSTSQSEFAHSLQSYIFSNNHQTCEIITADSLSNITSDYAYCISLLEFEELILSNLGERRFVGLQNALRIFKQLIWVTTDCATRPKSPESVFMSGFAKSIMREDPSCTIIYLNLSSLEDAATIVARVVDRNKWIPRNLSETDLLEERGIVYIPRVVEAPKINRLLDSTLEGIKPEAVDVCGDIKDEIQLHYVPGRLDSFYYGPDTSDIRPISETEVLIQVKATGLSSRDVLVVLNQLPSAHLGCEISGVIVEAGAKSGFSAGDRVCAFAISGGFRTYVRAQKSQVMTIPHEMPFTEASAIPLAYLTAQYSLCHVAHLSAGESILIHAAAGAVGQAAIQIAQRIGAIVYVTVGTPEKKQFLMDKYTIAASRCFSSRHISFARQLMQQTGNRGVDVVLNSLSGLALTETWRCIAPLGRFVEIGKRDIIAARGLPMDPFQRNVSYSSVDMAILEKTNNELANKIKHEVQAMILDGTSRQIAAPEPMTIYKLSEVENALRWLQTGRHMGKAVISWELRDTIQVRDGF